MNDIFFSPHIVPLGGFAAAAAIVGFTAWRKVRERELNIEFDLRQREMDHQIKSKELDLEMARLKAGNPEPGKDPAQLEGNR